MDLGVRTWGNSPDGETVLLTGTYQLEGEVSRRLLRALPPLLVLRADDWDCPLDRRCWPTRSSRTSPGQEAVLDRLLDLLLIAVAAGLVRAARGGRARLVPRRTATRSSARRCGCCTTNPADPWTVAALADAVGVSRAALARRFHELVGEPPMAFLTGWRIALAADLLLEPGATVGSVAPQVGYGSPFALSTAFKRLRGVSPQEHRRAS